MSSVLIVGSDHAGLELKRELASIAASLGYEVRDVGTHTSDSTDYPDYAHQVASAVAAGEGLGLLVCGTGLGMSIASDIVKKHKGGIDIRSDIGKGTTFTIRLPFQEEVDDA